MPSGGPAISLTRRLLLAQAYLLAIALIFLAWPWYGRERERARGAETTLDVARLSAAAAANEMRRTNGGSPPALHAVAEAARASLKSTFGIDRLARVIIVDGSGRRVADSSLSSPPTTLRRMPREELAQALDGRSVQLTRYSGTLDAEIRLTAVPVAADGEVVGALRITQSSETVNLGVANQLRRVALVSAAFVAMGLIVAILLSRALLGPMRALEASVRRVSAGDLSTRARVAGSREQRVIALAFNDMTARLEALIRSQEDFVANASHQLRTPLTGIRLRLELLRRQAPADRQTGRNADEALFEVDRLSGIVDDLLTLSQPGEPAAEPTRIDLNDVVRAVAGRWRATADAAGVLLETTIPNEASPAVADAGSVDRVLDALIENAVAYSPRGATVQLVSGPGCIRVVDEGPGLADGEEEAVFARFQRGHAGRNGPRGTGLGLAIARELMERSGGSVTLRNRSEGGAEARLTLATTVEERCRRSPDFTLA